MKILLKDKRLAKLVVANIINRHGCVNSAFVRYLLPDITKKVSYDNPFLLECTNLYNQDGHIVSQVLRGCWLKDIQIDKQFLTQ